MEGNVNGATGPQGSSVMSGSTGPTAGQGDEGDTFIDSTSGDLYIKGPTGWYVDGSVSGPNSFTPFTQLGPETNGGKDLIIGNSTRPGFIPSSIVIYYATSGISSNSIGLKQESKLFLYCVNPALSPTPFLIDTLHIDANLIPNSDTRIYTPSLYPSATVNAGYALVLQSGATNYMISGYVYMNP